MTRKAALLTFALVLAACGADEPVSWVDQQYAQNMAHFGDDPDVLWRDVDADTLVGLVDLAVHLVEQHLGARHLQLEALATHLLDEDGELQLTTAE